MPYIQVGHFCKYGQYVYNLLEIVSAYTMFHLLSSVPGDRGKDSFQNIGNSLHAETSGHK